MIDLGICREKFLANHYEKQPYLKRKAINRDCVCWDDVNSALFAWDPSDGRLRLFKNGAIPPEIYIESFEDIGIKRSRIVKDIFYDLIRNGATLVLNRMEIKSPPIQDLTMLLSRFLGERIVANGYVAFGGNGSFSKHWDTHDVFAIQLIGRKIWRLYEPTFALPLPNQTSKNHKQECPLNPIMEVTLEEGDVLYIPRGWWHEAVPISGQETFHIAAGVHPILLSEYINWVAQNQLPNLAQFRRSLKAERQDVNFIDDAMPQASSLFKNEMLLSQYKREKLSAQRVVSRFSIETFGEAGATEIIGLYFLNSSYIGESDDAVQVVNGLGVVADPQSKKELAELLRGVSIPHSKISQLSVEDKFPKLIKDLLAKDVISFISLESKKINT